jgi:DNA-binding NtrC family response regulator/pSer/pThr/pTyr-binding forkhead associated (FHA) protein
VPDLHDEERTRLDPPAVAGGAELRLLVVGEGASASRDLPPTGSLVVGRAREADVRVDVPSLSRRHAAVHVDAGLSIEDLGSANGTRVRGERVAPGRRVPFVPGEVVELGSTVLVVQLQRRSGTRAFRLWSIPYLETRLEEECARAAETSGRVGLLWLESTGPQAAITEALAESLGPMDVAATSGAAEWGALLGGASAEIALATKERLVDALHARSAGGRVGLACMPRHGRSAEMLLARARDEARGETPRGERSGPVVETDTLRRLEPLLDRVAATKLSLLVLGESGVGKEIVVDRLHALSPRRDRPLVKLNCAALPETLLESELFGHERGAFTDAVRTKPGLFETAEGGTVFLDEIGDLAPSMQAKLLRALESGEVRRVGGNRTIRVDVRFVSATQRDLESDVGRGSFRRDLYTRIAGVVMTLPPLRDRPDEIEPLARAFLADAAGRARRPRARFASETVALLRSYGWPGNVRELKNVVERAVALAEADEIRPTDLPLERMQRTHSVPRAEGLKAGVQAAERDLIVEALARTKGNQTKAARLLGISRRKLVKRIALYGLPQPRKRKPTGR